MNRHLPDQTTLTPKLYLETSLNVQRFFLGFRFCLKASENNPTKHKTCSHILESLIIWQFLLREGMGERGERHENTEHAGGTED